jgi:hypothetical protein
MTAFEILLNRFYDTIETSKPMASSSNYQVSSSNLSMLIRNYINTSFSYGSHLSYQPTLTSIANKAAIMLKDASVEEWERIHHAFTENDLHTIRRDRGKEDVIELKNRLEQTFAA